LRTPSALQSSAIRDRSAGRARQGRCKPRPTDLLLAKPDRAGSLPGQTTNDAGHGGHGIARGCPLATAQVRCEWHDSGTARTTGAEPRSVGTRSPVPETPGLLARAVGHGSRRVGFEAASTLLSRPAATLPPDRRPLPPGATAWQASCPPGHLADGPPAGASQTPSSVWCARPSVSRERDVQDRSLFRWPIPSLATVSRRCSKAALDMSPPDRR